MFLSHRTLINLIKGILILALLAGCQDIDLTGTNISPVTKEKPQEIPQAEITFAVQAPAALAEGQSLYIEFLDEVTGLALNPVRHKLQTEDQRNFVLKIPFGVSHSFKIRGRLTESSQGWVNF